MRKKKQYNINFDNENKDYVDRIKKYLAHLKKKYQDYINNIELHPEYYRYLKKNQCQELIENRLKNEQNKILNEYACYDGFKYYKGTCGKPKTIGDFDIKDHPNFHNYISRSEHNQLINKHLKIIINYYQNKYKNQCIKTNLNNNQTIIPNNFIDRKIADEHCCEKIKILTDQYENKISKDYISKYKFDQLKQKLKKNVNKVKPVKLLNNSIEKNDNFKYNIPIPFNSDF